MDTESGNKKIITFHHCENRNCYACNLMKAYFNRMIYFLAEHHFGTIHHVISYDYPHQPFIKNYDGQILQNHHDIFFDLIRPLSLLPPPVLIRKF